MRNCLTWFWKLKSPKYTICKLEILGCWWCKSQSESKGLRTRKTNGINLNLRTRKDLHSISSCQGEFSLTQALFYPGLHWILKKAHPHWGGQSALLSRQIQMLTSSRNTDTPRIIFNQISQPLMAQSGWHVKLTITESSQLHCPLGLEAVQPPQASAYWTLATLIFSWTKLCW